MDRIFMFMRKFCLNRVACPCPRAIYMYMTIISSPEPLGSQGELIVYPGSVARRRCCRRRRRSHFSIIFLANQIQNSCAAFLV